MNGIDCCVETPSLALPQKTIPGGYMGQVLDREFFRELERMNFIDVCSRALCGYDEGKKAFLIEAWGETHEVYPASAEILKPGGKKVAMEAGLVILFYLLRCRNRLVSGEWITEKDIPGGVAFFTGPHAIPSHLVTGRYGNDIEGFMKSCLSLGGIEIQMGHAAYTFPVLRRIPVTVLMWKGDDEFPPDVRLLFDRTVHEHLPLDVIFALSVETLRRISRPGSREA